MAMYLKRKVYDMLAAWKQKPGHATLEVSGARQVGNFSNSPFSILRWHDILRAVSEI